SAVLDKKGNLVGLAFDENYEAITSDWIYDDDLTRAISVDIRFLLLLLKDVEKAETLLNELTILY
ncbi:MAG: S46 family peptidase, partial [Candidatus Marinimicrobia bacterium]|nr:S46 family peptidase [Candidatus Neomarinimicrobiota bacterium]